MPNAVLVSLLLVSACSDAAAGSATTTTASPSPPPPTDTTTTTPLETTTSTEHSFDLLGTDDQRHQHDQRTVDDELDHDDDRSAAQDHRAGAIDASLGAAAADWLRTIRACAGVGGVAAFTGLPADETVTSRAALAVKLDNAVGGPPQWNLADADLVFEENVEGITRFVAVYQTNMPDRIGPVRSARTSDIDILASLNRPILAWSGGNPGVTSRGPRGAHVRLAVQPVGAIERLLLAQRYAERASQPAARPRVCPRQRHAGRPGAARVPARRWRRRAGRARRALHRPHGRARRDVGVGCRGAALSASPARWLARRRRRRPSRCRKRRRAVRRLPPLGRRFAVTRGGDRGFWSGGVAPRRAHDHGHVVASRRFSPFMLFADDGRPLTLAPGTTFVELAR